MKKNPFIGGMLLVAGTSIGGGMLALPITTGFAGFVPSLCILFLCWAYMTITAFLFLEVNMWLKGDTNIVTMAQHTLGVVGKMISWVVYLFLLYALTTAYLAGCGSMFLSTLKAWFDTSIPSWIGPIPFLFLFGSCVYLGTRPVDYINRILMAGLILTYVGLGVLITPNIEPENLLYKNWQALLPAVAVVVTAFGYHIIIPSLSVYFNYNVGKMKKALLFGGLIPLIIYFFWEALVLGIIPISGSNSLNSIMLQGNPEINVIEAMQASLQNNWIGVIARAFSYFAILTSFLGVSLSLLDFLADGLNIKNSSKGRLMAALLTFIPPFLIAVINPNIFLSALRYAGIFVATLLGIFPAAMAWSGRYRLKIKGEFHLGGGKALLLGVILFSIVVILLDIADQIGLFSYMFSYKLT